LIYIVFTLLDSCANPELRPPEGDEGQQNKDRGLRGACIPSDCPLHNVLLLTYINMWITYLHGLEKAKVLQLLLCWKESLFKVPLRETCPEQVFCLG
jgi:hypothetical protein